MERRYIRSLVEAAVLSQLKQEDHSKKKHKKAFFSLLEVDGFTTI